MNLKRKQQEAADYIVENILKNPLIESPTGSGKTFILLAAAMKLVQLGHKVIISKLCNNTEV